jgi:hypothetical protein
MAPPVPRKFTPEKQDEYIKYLRGGNLKYESARLTGVSYDTILRRRKADPEFRDKEQHALAEAREGVEKVVFDMALQGDISAIKLWLSAHDKSTYSQKQTIEFDATPNAVELSRNEAISKIANLQQTLAARAEQYMLDAVDVESEEL